MYYDRSSLMQAGLLGGSAVRQATMLTVSTPDALLLQGQPIWKIKPLLEAALANSSPTYDRMYTDKGPSSIPPEHLMKGVCSSPSSRSRWTATMQSG